METSDIITLGGNVLIPIIIGGITFLIAKKQIVATGVTQFRQKWIDELRDSISIFISKAEMIAMLDFTEEDLYLVYFQDLSRIHSKIELMLNPNEPDHNTLIAMTGEIRDLIHDEGIKPDKLEMHLTHKITQLLEVAKVVLKKEWVIVKRGK